MKKYPYRDMGNGKVRSVGVAMSMQGSGISAVDTGAVEIKVNDDGFYSLIIGATDMGNRMRYDPCPMAAECLECKPEEVVVFGVDTDISPYDCGSYASSTTYVTGQAVVKTCESLRKKNLRAWSRVSRMQAGRCRFRWRICNRAGNRKADFKKSD